MAAALRSPAVRRACEPVVVGEPVVWRRAGWTPELAPLADTRLGLPSAPAYGRVSAEAGRASFAAVALATRLCARGAAQGLVTAPISKAAWALAGAPYPDHTEYFRSELSRPEAQMILGAPRLGLWCVTATRHIPLREVPASLSRRSIASCARALNDALRALGKPRPRLGLCALNPHAGEEGIIGAEEEEVLAPAAAAARASGLLLAGPVPADTAWRWHLAGRFDGLVSLFHDQALIPLKTAAGLSIVNWTWGLPFPRTSPGHGTGFDVAGTKKIDPAATIEAVLLCTRLAAAKGQ